MNMQSKEQLLKELEELQTKRNISIKTMQFTKDENLKVQEDNSLSDDRKNELAQEHEMLEVFHSIEIKALETKIECIKQMLIRNSSDVWDVLGK